MQSFSYTIIQWLFFFYFYCFFGWCFESAYVSLKKRRLTNRGFMRGPFLPLYGSGAMMMLIVARPFLDLPSPQRWILTYVAGCIGATILEYITGVTMEALFKVRYWDYSRNPLNFQGHICLGTSLAWGVLTLFMTEILHRQVERIVFSVPYVVLTVLTLLLTVLIAGDLALSFKAALDLKDVLVRMEKARTELVHLQKRLDVIIAIADEEIEQKKEEFVQRKDEFAQKKDEFTGRVVDLKEGIEDKFETIINLIHSKSGEHLEGISEELGELKTKYTRVIVDHESLTKLRDFFQRDMIRSNPTMTSPKFRESFEELKEQVKKKNKK